MKRHEKTKLKEPRISKARSQSGPSLPCSHLNRFRMKSREFQPNGFELDINLLTSNHSQNVKGDKSKNRVMSRFRGQESRRFLSSIPDGPALASEGM